MLADKYTMRTKPYPDDFDKLSFMSFIQMLWELCDTKGDSNRVFVKLDRHVNTREVIRQIIGIKHVKIKSR